MRAAIAALESVPGVARVYRGDLMRAGPPAEDPLARAISTGYHPGRSGDLLMVPRAYWITSGAIATHGTSYAYDSRVPVLLYGAGVKPGRYLAASTPADIAPTLAYLAGVTLPQPDGRVLHEALEPAPRARHTPLATP
jgi:hypothetical protein